MKRFKQMIAATITATLTATMVATTLGLSGCDAINEGYEVGMATVEFVETQESIFGIVGQIEQRLSGLEDLEQIIAVQHEVINDLKQQQQQVASGEMSETLKLMSGLLVDDIVMMLENNVMMLAELAPMHMSIAERFNAVATEQSYQQHKEKLLSLQSSVSELGQHIDGDVQAMSAMIEKSTLPQELQFLLLETIEAFNREYKKAITGQYTDIPATVTEEIKWLDYIYEHKNNISVNEQNKLVFATQEALDHYNTLFGQ